MPLVTVRCRSKGLPIATTGSPTSIFEESPSVNGWSFAAGASTFKREVGVRFGADHFGRVHLAFRFEGDADLFPAFDDVVVGQHVAFVVEDDAGAGGDAFGHLGFDEGDAVGVRLVDLVDGVAFAVRRDVGDGVRAGGPDDFAGGGGTAASRHQPRREGEGGADGDDCPAQEGRAERMTSLLLGHGGQICARCSPCPKCARTTS